MATSTALALVELKGRWADLSDEETCPEGTACHPEAHQTDVVHDLHFCDEVAGPGCHSAPRDSWPSDDWQHRDWQHRGWQHRGGQHRSWQHRGGQHRDGQRRGGPRRGGYDERAPRQKWQCQFIVGLDDDPHFQVVKRILGLHGSHMKAIASSSNAKLRLRGRGSGFLEGPEQKESEDALMLCVSATDEAGYDKSVQKVTAHLKTIYRDYVAFCKDVGRTNFQSPCVTVHEGPRAGSH